jgi:hypothetical protein
LTISVVLADANILFSRTLRDYVLYAADEGAIEVHWTRQILAEMSRTCARTWASARTAPREAAGQTRWSHSSVQLVALRGLRRGVDPG